MRSAESQGWKYVPLVAPARTGSGLLYYIPGYTVSLVAVETVLLLTLVGKCSSSLAPADDVEVALRTPSSPLR